MRRSIRAVGRLSKKLAVEGSGLPVGNPILTRGSRQNLLDVAQVVVVVISGGDEARAVERYGESEVRRIARTP